MREVRRSAILLRQNVPLAITSRVFHTIVIGLFLLILGLSVPALAAESSSPDTDSPAKPSRIDQDDLELLREANRLLEEEIKLASRPQIYVVLDLGEKLLFIKGRGVELHRFPIKTWRVSGAQSVSGLFRLRARPTVTRPKAVPGHDPSLEPIGLEDMPAEYLLVYDPGLFLVVAPAIREQPWLWAWSRLREWWTRLGAWTRLAASNEPTAAGPVLRLTLSPEAARSLAWSVTDGMPLLIGKITLP
ncbi:MAG: hypothetical protein HY205_04770 [Nitrospirae bacterium]|nr:hypothetical protein [Nitrospirota bacterium]